MDSFEEAFENAEKVSDEAIEANKDLLKQLRRLRKAAQDGRITGVKREQGKLADTLDKVTEAVNDAVHAWPYDEEEEVQYLRGGYVAELRLAASQKGLTIYERDGDLIAYPSVVRITPEDRAVLIGRKREAKIRPSHLADQMLKAQKSPVRFAPRSFLRALYQVYKAITKESSTRPIGGNSSPVILLNNVYRMFTSRPGSARDYSKTDFAREIYELDRSGVTKTRSGATMSFHHASTGVGSSRDLYTFVGPDGHEVKYYGIRFMEG